ncbi:hypothetical protein OG453_00775 [Streptomyces sp. NBC_01381]|uniref:hypothetical protein n=1 Tax=Streptomyces sp. NBC_01381 TaxID=2903845 RepID=UPI0022590680|nr:hypothetical protein [Streptomyces sp. NBC_01381]MCX4665219.1 hypothetical protein [Streptomyces sp. NBC_01381]
MTEPHDRKHSRKSRVYGLVAAAGTAAVATAVSLAYYFGAFDSWTRERIQADEVCRNLNDKQSAADIFNSALPPSSHYDLRERFSTDTGWRYRINCGVDDGDNRLLSLTAHTFTAPSQKVWEDELLPPLKGKATYFDAGVRGVSTPGVAGIYVPCYRSGRKDALPNTDLNVYALAVEPLQGSDKENRQQLIDLALDFAHTAHKQADCDRPSKLPDRVTAPDV